MAEQPEELMSSLEGEPLREIGGEAEEPMSLLQDKPSRQAKVREPQKTRMRQPQPRVRGCPCIAKTMFKCMPCRMGAGWTSGQVLRRKKNEDLFRLNLTRYFFLNK